jgi:LysR family transcriptional regulator, glycine cleavage system transcriptional activator
MPMRRKSNQVPPRRSGARRKAAIRRLPLASLRVFVAVAEHQSLAQAAAALGVTNGAVTLQIQSLEAYLGVPLFLRRGHAIALTAAGVRLLPRIDGSLREIEAALDEARHSRSSGAFTVSMLGSFLQQWWLPRMRRFRDRHPEIDLRIHTSLDPVRFAGSDIQAAIRLGKGQWTGLHAEKLLDEWLVPVCSRALRDRMGWLETPADLARFPLLHALSEPWTAWSAGGEWRDNWPDSGTSFDDSVAVIRAAEDGQGLALGRWTLAASVLEQGGLVIASRRIVRCDRSYYFVCPPEYLELPKVVALRDWLRGECAATVEPPGRESGMVQSVN